MAFTFESTPIQGLTIIHTRLFGDERGFFLESYKRSDFADQGIIAEFHQDNHSMSSRGVLRGLHFQRPPAAQGKLVRVVRGEVFDVGVDLRLGSPTFGHWEGVLLNETEGAMLYLPPGLAHGYCVLSPEADLAYKVTAEYSPEADTGIRWDDPQIGVEWPLDEPHLSERDTGLPLLKDIDPPFRFGGIGI